MDGPRAAPGSYSVRLTAGDITRSASFEVFKDPCQTDISQTDLEEQLDYLLQVSSALERLNEGREAIQSLRDQIEALVDRAEDESLEATGEDVIDKLEAIEEELVQTRPGGFAHPPKLRRNLGWVARAASSQRNVYLDARPTDQLWERFRDLERDLSTQLEALESVLAEDVARFNEAVLERGIPPVTP